MLSPLTGLAGSTTVLPPGTYTNNGTINNVPQINAQNVVNRGTFIVGTIQPYETFGTLNFTNTGIMEGEVGFRLQYSSPTTPARNLAANIVNLNPGLMQAVDPPTSFTFQGSPPPCDLAVVDPSYLWLFATNILVGAGSIGSQTGVNSAPGASLVVGADGDMRLIGTNVDLTSAGLEVLPVWDEPQGVVLYTDATGLIIAFQPDIALTDINWTQGSFAMVPPGPALNSAALWDGTIASAPAEPSPPSPANGSVGFSFVPLLADGKIQVFNQQSITLTNITGPLTNPTAIFTTNITVFSNIWKGAVFIGAPSTFAVADGMSGANPPPLGNGYSPSMSAALEVLLTNQVTGQLEPASLRIGDTLGGQGVNDLGIVPDVIGCPATGNAPRNYVNGGIQRVFATTGTPGAGTPEPNFFLDAGALLVDPGDVVSDGVTNSALTSGSYSGYSMLVDDAVSRPKPTPAGTFTNNPGRVNISAENLNLTGARIRGEGYIMIDTPHLVSSSNAVIDCPSLSFNVATTNGNLVVSNLSKTTADRLFGQVNLFSAIWSNTAFVTLTNNYIISTNVDTNTMTTNVMATPSNIVVTVGVRYQVLMVDASALQTVVPVSVYDFASHDAVVTLNDSMSIVQKLKLNAQTVTINGAITIPGTFPVNPVTGAAFPGVALRDWTASTAPNLLDFTNNGTLSIANEGHFGDDRPVYRNLINNGTITAAGLFVDSFYYENHGSLNAANSIFMNGDTGVLSGGSSTSGNLSQFMGNNLKFNQFQLQVNRGPLVFYVTNSLSDGGAGSGNTFTVSDGFQLLVKPATGDLLGTTISDDTPSTPSVRIQHYWAGEDRGATAGGFDNNVAIGTLTFLPTSPRPLYVFTGTGAANGLYVDQLDLSNLGGSLAAIQQKLQIDPNLVIYYASIKLAFTPPTTQTPEEYMNGQLGGHLRWVSGFAGPNSSTAVVIINPATGLPQSIQVNTALRNSKIIDSNGDGIPNGSQGYPFNGSPFNVTYLSVTTNGNGSVTPNYNGQLLISNAVYSMLAQPGDGFVFSGWSGSITSTNPLLTFTNSNNLSLTANFTYQPGAGNYSGLFYQSSGVQVGQSGSINITKSANGKFSGSIQLAGNRFSFSGVLDGNGAATVFPGGLQVQLQAGANQFTGTVSGDPPAPKPSARVAASRHTPDPAGVWTAPFQANLDNFSSKTNPAPFAGTYTMIFSGSGDITNTTEPFGDGYGTVTVDANGNVSFSGSLADGTKVTQSSTVSQNGQWPLFIPLYSGKGQLLSWQSFGDIGGRDVGGMFNWTKPATNGKLFPAAFNVNGDAVGSLYNSSLAPITGFGGGLLQFSGGDLSSNLTARLSIGSNNRVTNLGPTTVTMTLSPKQGFFSGSVTDPATRKKYNFNGAVFQKQTTGSGYFLGTDQSSKVTLTPGF